MSDEYYCAVKTKIQNLSKSNNLFNSLDRCRQLIKSNAAGSIILQYILLKMRHRIMRYQIADRPNNWISYLSLWNECIPFDKMPFDASLVYHNPSLFDVFSCISSKGREHEILSRKIRINTEQNVKLFTPIKDVEYIGNVQELANKFNTLLISKHVPVRSLVIEKDNVYIKGYEADTVTIINDLISRVGNGLTGYRNAMGTWLQETPTVDCEEKESILLDMFSKYDLALIYGAAGTGKTTLIKHLASYFADSSKLFLANTNPAKENLRRQIKVSNSEFSTIASCSPLVNGNNYDIVFIDECSTVDNAAMKELLKKLNCRLLVLVGDVYQIRSIKFGNWFSLARYFLPSNIVYELNGNGKFYSGISSKHQRDESGDRILFAAEKGCGRRQWPPIGERCKLQRRKCFHGIYGDQDCASQKGRNEFLSLCAVLFAERKRDHRAGTRNRFGVCEKSVAGA